MVMRNDDRSRQIASVAERFAPTGGRVPAEGQPHFVEEERASEAVHRELGGSHGVIGNGGLHLGGGRRLAFGIEPDGEALGMSPFQSGNCLSAASPCTTPTLTPAPMKGTSVLSYTACTRDCGGWNMRPPDDTAFPEVWRDLGEG